MFIVNGGGFYYHLLLIRVDFIRNWLSEFCPFISGFCPLFRWILLSRIVLESPKTKAFSCLVFIVNGGGFYYHLLLIRVDFIRNWLSEFCPFISGFCPLFRWILLSRIVLESPKTKAFSCLVFIVNGGGFYYHLLLIRVDFIRNWLSEFCPFISGFCPLFRWILLSRIVLESPKTKAFSCLVFIVKGVDLLSLIADPSGFYPLIG